MRAEWFAAGIASFASVLIHAAGLCELADTAIACGVVWAWAAIVRAWRYVSSH